MGQSPTFSVCLSVSVQSLKGELDEPPRGAEKELGEAGELTDATQFWPEGGGGRGGRSSDAVRLCEREEAHGESSRPGRPAEAAAVSPPLAGSRPWEAGLGATGLPSTELGPWVTHPGRPPHPFSKRVMRPAPWGSL